MFSFCVLHYLQGLREAVATLPSKRISDRCKGPLLDLWITGKTNLLKEACEGSESVALILSLKERRLNLSNTYN